MPIPAAFRPGTPGFWLLPLLPAVAVAGVIAFAFVRPAARLSKEGHATRASLAGVACENGTVIHYTYDVGAATYRGQASAASLGVSCTTLPPTGASLPILYLPSDPGTSMGALGLAQARREAALATGVAFLVVWIGSAALLRAMAARRT